MAGKSVKSMAATFLNSSLGLVGLSLIRADTVRESASSKRMLKLLRIASQGGEASVSLQDALQWSSQATSQLGQDLFALAANDFAPKGFFVEFGATDGLELSNSLLLEKVFAWEGILAEPAIRWQKTLRENRTVRIVEECVWSTSGQSIMFLEADEGTLSTVSSFRDSDHHGRARKTGVEYEVPTISLLDLLDREQAPRHINFLSIDTEGSEFDILSAFDFSKYSFSAICVEHNYTESRESVHALLSKNGYTRVLGQFSEWDDWFVPSGHPLATST